MHFMQHKRFAQGVCTLYDGFHHVLGIMPFDVNSLPEENEATRKAMGLH